mmetsp:Transcript_18241/g.30427  ORF Transcript_18241/g.30427 Transcript_18241/m.30427 type:complete len:385 (+) Transcript_18241:47-1201(+)
MNVLRANVMRLECGRARRCNFTSATRAAISRTYLPNSQSSLIPCEFGGSLFTGKFSQDGTLFLSGCQDEYIRVFDTSTKFRLTKQIHALHIGWSIIDIDLSPSGETAIYSSWSHFVHMISLGDDVKGQQEVLNFRPSSTPFCLFSIAFSSNGQEILGGANDACIYVYDMNVHDRVLKVQAHSDDINAIAFTDSSSNVIISGSDDRRVKLWDRRTLTSKRDSVGDFDAHQGGVTHIDAKGDGHQFITNSKDHSVRLWDIRKLPPADLSCRLVKPVMKYTGHKVRETLNRAYFSPKVSTGQQFICTGSANGSVFIYDVLTGEVLREITGHTATVRDVAWHPYLPLILSSSWDRTVGQIEYRDEPTKPLRRVLRAPRYRQLGSSGDY